ncbi:MAG TPA: histidine kinase [Chitinophagaceae bacterium]|nr:histidine kinase [Chitinophagaceae bacterium]
MPFKPYNKKEPVVLVWIMIPYITVMNALVFGACVFDSLALFLLSFLYSSIYLFLMYFVFGRVAILIRSAFSAPVELIKRIAVMLPVFYIMNVLGLGLLFFLYKHINLLNCPVKDTLWWAVLFGCLMSTGITFMNEGISNWELWKASIAETDKLRNAYQRSRLLGLKGQINPHFLFNCFNTLSGLIQEDEARAEKFLDEMTKVHRYLLGSDDDMLVPLQNEIRFTQSYLHLVKERFGDAITASININSDAMHFFLPPLSMQVVLEDIIYSNALSKTKPLSVSIFIKHKTKLCIVNSLHEKKIVQCFERGEGIDNLLNKYKLLNAPAVTVTENNGERTMVLPLFMKKEVLL